MGSIDPGLLELFRDELVRRTADMEAHLLEADQALGDPVERLEALMRAAHSLKGAARLVGVRPVERLAHVMEDRFVAIQRGAVALGPDEVEGLLSAIDALRGVAQQPDAELMNLDGGHLASVLDELGKVTPPSGSTQVRQKKRPEPAPAVTPAAPAAQPAPAAPAAPAAPPVERRSSPRVEHRSSPPEERRSSRTAGAETRSVRVGTEQLDTLVGLVGETEVACRALTPRIEHWWQMRRDMRALRRTLDQALQESDATSLDHALAGVLVSASRSAAAIAADLGNEADALSTLDRRLHSLTRELHHAVLGSRMRTFSAHTGGMPRMVRDISRALGKEARLELIGGDTPADRDVLQALEAQLAHLVRNALAHGLETPTVRTAAGKPRIGKLHLSASKQGRRLSVVVEDDGAGVDLDVIRQAVVARGLAVAEVAATLTDPELIEFLFLPGFSTKETANEIAGRGVGLDSVRTAVRQLGGTVRMESRVGEGSRIELSLPLTLAVARILLVRIGDELYGLPVARVRRVLRVPRDELVERLGRHHLRQPEGELGLIDASELLEVHATPNGAAGLLPVVVIGGVEGSYALVVQELVGERELALRPLDARLGDIPDVAACSVLADGTPVVVLDVDSLLAALSRMGQGDGPTRLREPRAASTNQARILVVDDSDTVREMERQVLAGSGHLVDVAVDGADGWRQIRSNTHDLLVTDIDMPRMDGLELLRRVRAHPALHDLPVVVVSYKDDPETTHRVMEAGADRFLPKRSFTDGTFLEAVHSLLGGQG